MEASTKPNDAWSLRFKVEVFIWCRVVHVPKSSTIFRGILIWAIFRPVICENTFLCSVLHWRIISIKRFFSGIHACVNGADALTNFSWASLRCLFNLSVHRYRLHMHSWKEALNTQKKLYTCMLWLNYKRLPLWNNNPVINFTLGVVNNCKMGSIFIW
jgi:hypothetical protein